MRHRLCGLPRAGVRDDSEGIANRSCRLGIFLECALHARVRLPYRRHVSLYLADLQALGKGSSPPGLGRMSVSDLPALNASLNALATVL